MTSNTNTTTTRTSIRQLLTERLGILANLARRVFYDDGNESSVDEYPAELRQKVNLMEAFDHLFPSKRPMSTKRYLGTAYATRVS
jgi:hypothetical protein